MDTKLQAAGYPPLTKVALNTLVVFVTAYLCEQAFSTRLDVKNRKRNRLGSVDNELQLSQARKTPV